MRPTARSSAARHLKLWPPFDYPAVGLEAAARAEDVVPHPCRVADVEHEPAIALPRAGVGKACFLGHAGRVPGRHLREAATILRLAR